MGVLLYVLRTLCVPAHDDTRVALTSGEFKVWICLKILRRNGVANGIGGDHALVVIKMLLKVVFQNVLDHGGTLTVPGDDERAPVVAILKIVVQRCLYVLVGYAGKRRIDISGLLRNFSRVPHAGLPVERHENVGGVLVHACICHVFAYCAHDHLGGIKRCVIGSAFLKARLDIHRRINVECIDILGDFRKL